MCNVPGCENEGKGALGICTNCYGSILRWTKRSQEDQVARLLKLGIWSARIDTMLPGNLASRKLKRVDKKWEVLPGEIIKKRKKKKT